MPSRRQPTALRVAAGNPSRRPINDREPKPSRDGIAPPDTLTAAERVRWDRLCPMLCECGVMTVAEIDMLVRYCTMAAQFDECQAALQKQFDFKTANHQLKLADRLLAVERQLGMTPAARTGIIVGKPADDRNAIELALFG